jgi:predicted anti-sigma-YlaC factor YlaD
MNQAASGACPEYEAKLEDHLNGELSGVEARNVAAHLRSCSACSGALKDAEASVRLLRMAEPAVEPGPAFARTVMARIQMERASSISLGMWQPFISFAWRLAATAALALALMVTYDVGRHQGQSDLTVASARGAEMRDLFTTDTDRVPVNRDDVLLMVAESNHANGKH